MIELTQDKCSLLIDEQHGARIAQLNIDGLTLLVEKNDNPLAWGCYPMAPWVGRLPNGQLHVENKLYQFPLNLPPHAIHGTCLDVEWQVISNNHNSALLETVLSEPWPYRGKVQQKIELFEDRLLMQLCVYSEKDNFPASIGWHPWFKRKLERGETLNLEFEAEHKYECDENQIPTGKLIPIGNRPWDDCFTGVKENPRLIWPKALCLEISSNCSHWIVYDKPEHAICVEPITAPTNAINNNSLPVDFVRPQDPLCANMQISWRLIKA